MCLLVFSGYLARNVYEGMRREAAALKIQRDLRMFLARKDYTELCSAAVSVQAGMRGMVARDELCFRRQTKAARIIQVHLFHNCISVVLVLTAQRTPVNIKRLSPFIETFGYIVLF